MVKEKENHLTCDEGLFEEEKIHSEDAAKLQL